MRIINVGKIVLGEEEKRAVNEVVDSNWLSEGKKVHEFEKEWANFIGTKNSTLTNSGTSALITGLKSLMVVKNIKENSKVITTPLTYVATINALVHAGLEPIFIDVEEETFTINAEKIKEYLEKNPDKISTILPVHLMGYVADMDKINNLAKKYNLSVVEDAAQAHGSIYNGKKAGSLSDFSIFSFYIAHNIQVGEMGAINTSNYEISRLSNKIKANGRFCDCAVCTRKENHCIKKKANECLEPRFTHDLIGYNFKSNEFSAAIGLVQLKRIKDIIKKRNNNVKYLNDNLEKFSDMIKIPKYSKEISYLAYPLIVKKTNIISRNKITAELEKRGIETRQFFGCIPTQQPSYAHLKKFYQGKLPIAESIGENGFYIGCHQYLTQEDLDYIVKSFKEILKGAEK